MENKPKILYVDDERINLLLFEVNFKKDYEVLIAYNGPEGLKKLNANPDTELIISDMKMPGMSGVEFIRKAKEQYPNKKYYILTGFEITEEISEALDTELILQYFSKPFDIKRMHKIIAEALES
jgi:response regulator RpfG family c-di-GMP phosphodiesterase